MGPARPVQQRRGGGRPGTPAASHAKGPPPGLIEMAAAAGLSLVAAGRRLDVVLDAPDRRNAQTPATWRALAAAGTWASEHADLVVLRATGP